MDVVLMPLLFLRNREKEPETQKEGRLMEEKKKKKQEEKRKKEGAQKKVWLKSLPPCLYDHPTSHLHCHGHHVTELHFLIEVRC